VPIPYRVPSSYTAIRPHTAVPDHDSFTLPHNIPLGFLALSNIVSLDFVELRATLSLRSTQLSVVRTPSFACHRLGIDRNSTETEDLSTRFQLFSAQRKKTPSFKISHVEPVTRRYCIRCIEQPTLRSCSAEQLLSHPPPVTAKEARHCTHFSLWQRLQAAKVV
jgi:hypothetical protein